MVLYFTFSTTHHSTIGSRRLVRVSAFQHASVVKVVGSNPAAGHWLLGLRVTGVLQPAYKLRANWRGKWQPCPYPYFYSILLYTERNRLAISTNQHFTNQQCNSTFSWSKACDIWFSQMSLHELHCCFCGLCLLVFFPIYFLDMWGICSGGR